MNQKLPDTKMSNVDVSGCERASYPFAVNSNLRIIRKSVSLQLGYLPDRLHVGRVAPGSEDDGNLGFGVDVGRSNQSSCGIAGESNKVHRDGLSLLSAALAQRDAPETHLSLQSFPKHRRHVVSFRVWRAETFGPTNEDSMIYSLLPR